MTDIDYDDPVIEEEWCNNQRDLVIRYMESTGATHGEIGDWPAWHLAPYMKGVKSLRLSQNLYK